MRNACRKGEHILKYADFVQPDLETWLKKFHFSVLINPRYSETDMSGHINNVSYFIYFEQGRVDYFSHLDVSKDLFNEKTVGVTADLECQYLQQSYLRDKLRLYVRTARLGRSSFDLEYALVEETTGQLKATGRGAMVHIDRASGRSCPIPDAAREKILAFEGASLQPA